MSGTEDAGRAPQDTGAPETPETPEALEVRRDDVAHGTGTAPWVAAAGELDAASSPPLVAAVSDAVSAADAGRVVVDLDGITFCDSRGLSALIVSTTSAARAGVSLRLVAGSGSALSGLLRRTGMTELLPLHPDTDAALAAGASSPLEHEVAPETR